MNKKFRLLIIFLCLIFSLQFIAFGCDSDEEKITMSNKVSSVQFYIYWMPNDLTNENFAIVKECGIDGVHIGTDQAGAMDGDYYKNVIELIKNNNLLYTPYLTNGGPAQNKQNPANLKLYNVDVVNMFKGDEVKFIGLMDEPYYTDIDDIAGWIPEFERKYPDSVFYCTLLPEYVDTKLLGAAYQKYVDYYCSKVLANLKGEKWLAVDYYPYLYDDENLKNDGIYQSWLHNFETFRYAIKELDNAHLALDFQTCGMSSIEKDWRIPTEKEIRQQIYVALAYGFEMFDCYTYGKPLGNDYHPANKATMVDPDLGDPNDGYKTSVWYAVQQVIKEFKGNNGNIEGLEKIYLTYDYEGTKTFTGSESYLTDNHANDNFQRLEHQLTSLKGINSVYSSQDTVVSQFYNKDGNRAFFVINFSDPANGYNDRVMINFANCKRVKIYNKGVATEYDVKDGVLDFNIESGDGCFIIPL